MSSFSLFPLCNTSATHLLTDWQVSAVRHAPKTSHGLPFSVFSNADLEERVCNRAPRRRVWRHTQSVLLAVRVFSVFVKAVVSCAFHSAARPRRCLQCLPRTLSRGHRVRRSITCPTLHLTLPCHSSSCRWAPRGALQRHARNLSGQAIGVVHNNLRESGQQGRAGRCCKSLLFLWC